MTLVVLDSGSIYTQKTITLHALHGFFCEMQVRASHVTVTLRLANSEVMPVS